MGGGKGDDFGETKGSFGISADDISNLLALMSIVPGLDSITNLLSIPVDLCRSDYFSALLDLIGVLPIVGEFGDAAKLGDKAVDASKAIKAADKAADAAKTAKITKRLKVLEKNAAKISKRSPIKIPSKAITKVESKNGYYQIKYTWSDEQYKYISRWHTRTPNAPKNQGDSWVVERIGSGVGYGKDARPKRRDILVGNNRWISHEDWRRAITARKNGTATKQQKEWLDNGHWKDHK